MSTHSHEPLDLKLGTSLRKTGLLLAFFVLLPLIDQLTDPNQPNPDLTLNVETGRAFLQGGFWGLVAILLIFSQVQLRVSDRDLQVRRLFSRKILPFGRLARLYFYPSFSRSRAARRREGYELRGSYYLETDLGESVLFRAQRSAVKHHETLTALLQSVEQRSGLEWQRMSSTDVPQSFSEELARITGLRGRSLLSWLLRNTLIAQLEVTGVVAPRILNAALIITIVALIVLVQLLGNASLWATAAAVAAYCSFCLTVNLLALTVRAQRWQWQSAEGELLAAREVQRQLLPVGDPEIPGFEVASYFSPAREVAGDFYDVVETPDGRTVIVIADASGKGLAPALLMTMAKGHLAARLQAGADLVTALDGVNREVRVRASGRGRMFITMALAEIGGESGRVRLVRAGHEPPLLKPRVGAPKSLEPRGIALGLDAGDRFASLTEVEDVLLEEGDSLVFFSDGVTEARGLGESLYGDERLRMVVASSRGSASDLLNDLLSDLEQFRSDVPPSDDTTIVVLRRLPRADESPSTDASSKVDDTLPPVPRDS